MHTLVSLAHHNNVIATRDPQASLFRLGARKAYHGSLDLHLPPAYRGRFIVTCEGLALLPPLDKDGAAEAQVRAKLERDAVAAQAAKDKADLAADIVRTSPLPRPAALAAAESEAKKRTLALATATSALEQHDAATSPTAGGEPTSLLKLLSLVGTEHVADKATGGTKATVVYQRRKADGSLDFVSIGPELFHEKHQGDALAYLEGKQLQPNRAEAAALMAFFLALHRCEPADIPDVQSCGWQPSRNGKPVFALPGELIGQDVSAAALAKGCKIVLPGITARGTLTDWQDGVAQYAVGNHLVTHGVLLAAAGSMLKYIRDEAALTPYLLNVHCKTSKGKTHLSHVVASFWGHPDPKASVGFGCTWGTTDNMLLTRAVMLSGTCLVVDDLKMAPKGFNFDAFSMNFASGSDKARMSWKAGVGKAAVPGSFDLFGLSTGEDTFEQVIANYKLKDSGGRDTGGIMGGQEFRVVNLSAALAAGGFLYDTSHHFADGKELSAHLYTATHAHYGHAGPAFVRWLVAYEKEVGAAAIGVRLHSEATAFIASLNIPENADSAMRRAAYSMGFVCAVGSFLVDSGVIAPMTKANNEWAMRQSFASFIEARGGYANKNDLAGLQALAKYFRAYRSDLVPVRGAAPFTAKAPYKGYFRAEGTIGNGLKVDAAFLLTRDQFNAVIEEPHRKSVLAELRKRGFAQVGAQERLWLPRQIADGVTEQVLVLSTWLTRLQPDGTLDTEDAGEDTGQLYVGDPPSPEAIAAPGSDALN